MSDTLFSASSSKGGKGAADRTVTVQSGRILASDLLGEGGLLRIEHRGEDYVLRITKNNKLILTK